MSLLFSLLPYKWWGIGAIVASLLLALGVQTLRLSANKTELAVSRQAFSDYTAKAEAAARTASEESRVEEQRRASAIGRVVNAAIKSAEAVVSDSAAVRAAHDRLLSRYRAALRGAAPGDPAIAAGSPPAAAAADLSTELLARLGEAARQLALVADERGIAGSACVRSYESLTK